MSATSAPTTSESSGFSRSEASYAALASCFVVVLVLTNIIGVKLFELFPDGGPGWLPFPGPHTLTSGIITYPLTFLITDLVSEIWGRKRANFMVVLGFVFSFMMLGIVRMARILPPSSIWGVEELGFDHVQMQTAFEATFFYPSLLLFASMTAYLVAQLFDVRLYHFWWRVTGGKHMWIRNNGSTMISQLADTIIVNGIFLRFGLDMGWGLIAEIVATVYVYKLVLAVIDTPLIYLGRYLLTSFLGLKHGVAGAKAPLA